MAWRNKLLLNLIILTDIFYHFLLRVQKYKNLERLKMIAKFRAHGNRWTAQNRKPIDLSLHDYLFLCKECCYFCLVSSRNLEALQTFDYFYNRLAKFLAIKLVREPYDFIHHLQNVRSGLVSCMIFNLLSTSSGSLISSSTSSSLDTSITLSAGFSCFSLIFFEFPNARKCCPHLLLTSRKQYPCRNPRNLLLQRHQWVPSPN